MLLVTWRATCLLFLTWVTHVHSHLRNSILSVVDLVFPRGGSASCKRGNVRLLFMPISPQIYMKMKKNGAKGCVFSAPPRIHQCVLGRNWCMWMTCSYGFRFSSEEIPSRSIYGYTSWLHCLIFFFLCILTLAPSLQSVATYPSYNDFQHIICLFFCSYHLSLILLDLVEYLVK